MVTRLGCFGPVFSKCSFFVVENYLSFDINNQAGLVADPVYLTKNR
jgi:hypothetical protein